MSNNQDIPTVPKVSIGAKIKTFMCKWFSLGKVCLYMVVGMMTVVTPVRFTPIDAELSHTPVDNGDIRVVVMSTVKGYGEYNVFGSKVGHTLESNIVVVRVECTQATTIITGFARYRAPDTQSSTYACPSNQSIDIIVGEVSPSAGWITFAYGGIAIKVALRDSIYPAISS